MDKGIRIALITIGVILASAFLLLGGIAIGRFGWGKASAWQRNTYGISPDRFNRQPALNAPSLPGQPLFNFGKRFGFGMGPGMMGGFYSGANVGAKPLSIDQVEKAVETYISKIINPDLALGEIMVFDNHAYAEIYEKSTGIGAMEVLIDPVSGAVYPEQGPNMMWNLKYGMHSGYAGGFGMMGRMMGGYFNPQAYQAPADISADMPVSEDAAIAAAQKYLDTYMPGSQVDPHADKFYGYYTLHILQDDQVVGMLSVNGFTEQVFPHTWHGTFIEMSEEE